MAIESPTLRYVAPSTQTEIAQELRDLGMADGGQYIHLSHAHPKEGATRPGTTPLMYALRDVGGQFVVASVADHDAPSEKASQYMQERGVREAAGLRRILEDSPGFTAAKQRDPELRDVPLDQLMRMHGDTVHALSYLNSHDVALRTSLRQLGETDPDAYIAGLVDDKMMHAAAFVDAAIGSWVMQQANFTKRQGRSVIIDRDDWPPANVPVHADIGNNHGVVPSLDNILKMHPRLRNHQLKLFGNMVLLNNVLALHTRQDEENLNDIATHLAIPAVQRALVYTRYLMPPTYVRFERSEQSEQDEKVAPFIRDAVAQRKIIAGVLERLDFIKMDLPVLDSFDALLTHLAQAEDGQEMLDNFRIAMVGRPANFPADWKMHDLYSRYNGAVEQRIQQINQRFREITQKDEDFILVHRDAAGKMTGYPHEAAKEEVYPHMNIQFQLGQEGLCQTIQEGMITTAFGKAVPRPAVGVVSSMVGFAEKAQEHGMPHVLTVDDPLDPEQTIRAFRAAYVLAKQIREEPGSALVDAIIASMRTYYDGKCKDSFYAGLLATLIEKRQRDAHQLQ